MLEHGVDDRGVFVQHYGTTALDASLLTIPLVGFLPPDDERVANTVTAIQDELTHDGFVLRYGEGSRGEVDGVAGPEGVFLPCTFWLADNLVLQGRIDEGQAIYDRLTGLANDLGLLGEEYDVARGRLVGNFPQAFTHVALVNTAHNLRSRRGPAQRRGEAT